LMTLAPWSAEYLMPLARSKSLLQPCLSAITTLIIEQFGQTPTTPPFPAGAAAMPATIVPWPYWSEVAFGVLSTKLYPFITFPPLKYGLVISTPESRIAIIIRESPLLVSQATGA